MDIKYYIQFNTYLKIRASNFDFKPSIFEKNKISYIFSKKPSILGMRRIRTPVGI